MAYKNLENALHNEGITQRQFAEAIGVSEKTAYNKLKGRSTISIPESKKIRVLLPKYNADWLFQSFEP